MKRKKPRIHASGPSDDEKAKQEREAAKHGNDLLAQDVELGKWALGLRRWYLPLLFAWPIAAAIASHCLGLPDIVVVSIMTYATANNALLIYMQSRKR